MMIPNKIISKKLKRIIFKIMKLNKKIVNIKKILLNLIMNIKQK